LVWQNHCVSIYPPKVAERFASPANAGEVAGITVEGRSASFVCGSFAALSLRIEDGAIAAARFRTNGCGFMIAAADVLCDWLTGKSVTQLHGLKATELSEIIIRSLERFPLDRMQCGEVVFEGLRDAMAEYRRHRIEEFQGEKALICTCFGVSEETIVNVIAENDLTDVDEVSGLCRAGSGCGSCRMLIAELIDSQAD
jgi:NifU-like protein